MSGPLNTDALIHDLATVLRNALHPNAQLGISGTMAARRLRDVLGLDDTERNPSVEARLREYLAPAAPEGVVMNGDVPDDPEITVVADGEAHPGEVLMSGPTWVTIGWDGRTADFDPDTRRAKSGADVYFTIEENDR